MNGLRYNLPARCCTGTCRCFGRRCCCIEFRVRRSDVCDRAQLSRFHIFDGRLPSSGCQSNGCGCQFNSRDAFCLPTGFKKSRLRQGSVYLPSAMMPVRSRSASPNSRNDKCQSSMMQRSTTFRPTKRQAMLEKLDGIYKDGISAREAVELHRIEKVLKAKAAST